MTPCPKCGSRTMVIDARVREAGFPRRRRSCPKCHYGFATVEIPLAKIDDRIEELLHWIAGGAEE